MSARLSAGEIDHILSEADSGVPVNDLMRQHGFTRAAFKRWRGDRARGIKASDDPSGSKLQRHGFTFEVLAATLAIAASLAAVASTGLTYWFWYDERRAPFAPMVTAGRMGFVFETHTSPSSTGPDPRAGRGIGAILASITATHSGGAHGTVEDVVLRVSYVGGRDTWLFSPHMELSEEALLASYTSDKDPSMARAFKAAFAGIHLPRDSSVNRLILFLPEKDRNEAQNTSSETFWLRPGDSQVEVLIRVGSAAYVVVGKHTFRTSSTSSLDGAVVFPVSAEVRAARAAVR